MLVLASFFFMFLQNRCSTYFCTCFFCLLVDNVYFPISLNIKNIKNLIEMYYNLLINSVLEFGKATFRFFSSFQCYKWVHKNIPLNISMNIFGYFLSINTQNWNFCLTVWFGTCAQITHERAGTSFLTLRRRTTISVHLCFVNTRIFFFFLILAIFTNWPV